MRANVGMDEDFLAYFHHVVMVVARREKKERKLVKKSPTISIQEGHMESQDCDRCEIGQDTSLA